MSKSKASFRGSKDALMELNDTLEQWDYTGNINIEEIESISSYTEPGSVEKANESKQSGEEDNDTDNEENENILRCKACGKIYRSQNWFCKHQFKCDGKRKAKTSVKLSEHQIRSRRLIWESMNFLKTKDCL